MSGMTGWTIRKAVPQDAEALAACIDAAYAIYAGRGLDLPAVSEGIGDDIRENSVWVAVAGPRIVGGLVLVLRDDHAVIANVAVDPSAAGSGRGRALMDQAEQVARQAGLTMLKLNTHAGIPQNVRLYEHLGWQVTGRSGQTVSMEKPVDTAPSVKPSAS